MYVYVDIAPSITNLYEVTLSSALHALKKLTNKEVQKISPKCVKDLGMANLDSRLQSRQV